MYDGPCWALGPPLLRFAEEYESLQKSYGAFTADLTLIPSAGKLIAKEQANGLSFE
jgi:hypothetical protein